MTDAVDVYFHVLDEFFVEERLRSRNVKNAEIIVAILTIGQILIDIHQSKDFLE